MNNSTIRTVNPQEYNEGACFELFGAIVRHAIEDYVTCYRKKRDNLLTRDDVYLFEKVRAYLFKPTGLEQYLLESGLDPLINIESVRRYVLQLIEKEHPII
jgi:hypothetical protein